MPSLRCSWFARELGLGVFLTEQISGDFFGTSEGDVALHCRHGRVCAVALKASPRCAALSRGARAACQMLGDQMELSDFLCLCQRHATLHWLFQQTLRQLSFLLQMEVMARNGAFCHCNASDAWQFRSRAERKRELASAALSSARASKAAKRSEVTGRSPAVSRCASMQQQLTPHQVQKNLCEYFRASRGALEDAKMVALCDDGSRKGGKERLCSLLMNLATGSTCFGPPQESRDTYMRVDMVGEEVTEQLQGQWHDASKAYIEAEGGRQRTAMSLLCRPCRSS